MQWVPRLALAAGASVLALLPAAPASAHSSDPRIVTVVEQVAPGLPDAVVVQARPGVAAQLVADNPTPTVLEVLSVDGEPFLRISAAGVQANVASPDFFTTSSPEGSAASVPDGAAVGAPPKWVPISTGTSWGWYDHRLHPEGLQPPSDVQQDQQLAQWAVPLRYGEQDVEVRGAVRFSPLRGAFLVTADSAPDGLVVQALPGMLPGLFVSNPDRLPVTVLGRDGEPFVRFGPQGVEVNVASRTHVEDRQARGLAVDPPSPTPRFEVVDAQATSYTWLDARLRYPDELPPDDVLDAAAPTVVGSWEVPVLRADQPATIAGSVTWVPQGEPLDPAAATAPEDEAPAWRPWALLAGAVALVGAVVTGLRRRTRSKQVRQQREESGARP